MHHCSAHHQCSFAIYLIRYLFLQVLCMGEDATETTHTHTHTCTSYSHSHWFEYVSNLCSFVHQCAKFHLNAPVPPTLPPTKSTRWAELRERFSCVMQCKPNQTKQFKIMACIWLQFNLNWNERVASMHRCRRPGQRVAQRVGKGVGGIGCKLGGHWAENWLPPHWQARHYCRGKTYTIGKSTGLNKSWN